MIAFLCGIPANSQEKHTKIKIPIGSHRFAEEKAAFTVRLVVEWHQLQSSKQEVTQHAVQQDRTTSDDVP
jgi:hypothetical protein